MALNNVIQFPTNPNTVFSVAPAKRGRGRPRKLPPSVAAFDSAMFVKRERAADEQAVKQTLEVFASLVKKHGCKRIHISGFANDNRFILFANSHINGTTAPSAELVART